MRGNKLFELSNHLGNVLVTVSDKKIGYASNDSTIDYYNPDVVSAHDYSPFGMSMVGRKFKAGAYRYGFNGQEKDDEIKGKDKSYTAEFWEYNSRLGRRWNLDPRPTVGVSDYSAFFNNPICIFDIRGDTPTVHEAAQMANDAYNNYADRRKIDGGWERIESFKGVSFEDKRTDFQAALYKRTINGKTEFTFATAGTASGKDGWQVVIQAVGASGQYHYSVQQAKRLTDLLEGQELTYTGHSLAGGTASANALATGKFAITFNAAGVSFGTKLREKILFKNSSSINAFIIPGEAVDYYQDRILRVSAEGTQIFVHPLFGELGSFKAKIVKETPQTVIIRVKLHMMSSVYNALEKSGYGSGGDGDRVVPKRPFLPQMPKGAQDADNTVVRPSFNLPKE